MNEVQTLSTMTLHDFPGSVPMIRVWEELGFFISLERKKKKTGGSDKTVVFFFFKTFSKKF